MPNIAIDQTHTHPAARRAAEDLMWVATYWPDLIDARLPGTARPWRQPRLTAEQRTERDQAAWRERLDRTGEAIGEAPAPLDLGVLGTVDAILTDAVNLADTTADLAGVPRVNPPMTDFVDARPFLAFIAEHLPALPGPAIDHVAQLAATWVRQTAHALALVHDGQWLAVVCPWCGGVTPETPAGGAYTWRVRQLPGDEIAIVCENDCEPPSKDVGTWWRGRPVWPLREWDWLAKRIAARDNPEQADRVPPRAGTYGEGGRA